MVPLLNHGVVAVARNALGYPGATSTRRVAPGCGCPVVEALGPSIEGASGWLVGWLVGCLRLLKVG